MLAHVWPSLVVYTINSRVVRTFPEQSNVLCVLSKINASNLFLVYH